jgi:hypothetical protein
MYSQFRSYSFIYRLGPMFSFFFSTGFLLFKPIVAVVNLLVLGGNSSLQLAMN